MTAGPPRYLELADELAERWSPLAPGTLVESEHQLADEFGVGRLTARESVRELERRLIVRRVMGRGTFTAHRVEYVVALGDVPSFRRVLADARHVAGVRSVSRSWRGAGTDRVFEVERILTIDGLVGSFARDSFSGDVAERVCDVLIDDRSIVDALADLGLAPRRAGVRVAMTMPDDDVAAALEYSAAVPPVWRLDSTTRDGDAGPVVHRSVAWMRPDMFDVVVRLGDDVGS